MSAALDLASHATQCVFRSMQFEDIDRVAEIESEIHSHPWSRGNFSDSLRAGYGCWVYLSGNEMIGYAIVMSVLDEAHLLNIGIARDHQGRGLGRALLKHITDFAASHGAAMMFLEVRSSNKNAIALYESTGFNEFSVRKGYYPASNGREDAILMGLTL
ncbi:MAG: ribosomal protein S18-alanine N-acetyltransferase [Methylobacillus sp.]|jgi:ribosomal-protein-alanine N-acetyltransferase|nr:ribosomal protein S18-alanine N-acetyltransferase [Methylobacillus sp.]